MTTRTAHPIHIVVHSAKAWKDALVVTFLVALVAAFLAQVTAPGRFLPAGPVTVDEQVARSDGTAR